MLIKKEYRTNNAIKYTLIDGIEKIDTGVLEDENISFINVYKKDRKKEDDFETIEVRNMIVYVCNDEGKTLQIIGRKK